jgi:hypothetical protein
MLLLASIAYAAEAIETQAWWQGMLLLVIQFFGAVLVPVLVALGMVFVKKYNFQIEQEKLEYAAEKAIGYGEQQMKKLLKDGKEVSGPEILKIAVEHGNKILEQYNLANKFGSWLGEIIEARLGQDVVAMGGAKAAVPGKPE